MFKFSTSGVQLKSFMIFQEIFGFDQQRISVMTEASLNHILACLTYHCVKIFGDFFYFFTVVELAPNCLLQIRDRYFGWECWERFCFKTFVNASLSVARSALDTDILKGWQGCIVLALSNNPCGRSARPRTNLQVTYSLQLFARTFKSSIHDWVERGREVNWKISNSIDNPV